MRNIDYWHHSITYLEKIMKKIILIITLTLSNLTFAGGGIIDINQTCAAVSCMAGDTLDFPVTITQPGSYRLTSNLVSSLTNTNVIRIESSNVTLDLNGFSIIGPRTCTGMGTGLVCDNGGMTSDGINGPNNITNITIKNGKVMGFDSGIAILGNADGSFIVDNIIAENNEEGILISAGYIRNSQANKNLRRGFGSISSGLLATGLKIIDSYAYGNKEHSAVALVCSNVLFLNNGPTSGIDGDAFCNYYTNGSYCKVGSKCIP